MNIGDTVVYSSKFLRDTQAHCLGHLTGTVRRIENFGTKVNPFILVTVLWNDGEERRVNIKNLVLRSKLHLEPA
jgi:hypothetical protein